MQRSTPILLLTAALTALACGDDTPSTTGTTDATVDPTTSTTSTTSTSTSTDPTTIGPGTETETGMSSSTSTGTTDPTTSTTAGLMCQDAELLCDDVCVDPNTDPNNCGDCDVACGVTEECVDGACASTCGPDEVTCDDVCVDPNTDPNNCGDCGVACAVDQECLDGACSNLCADSELYCDGACIDPNTDPNNCGDCGVVCQNGDECVDGACAPPFPWDQQKTVTVSSTNQAELTDCQVLVTLNPNNFDYPDALPNGEDIRFSTDGMMIDIPYWIESWDPMGDSRIWVRVPSIPADGMVDIYLLYGNPNAMDAADGDATFEFFDDFEDDNYMDKWDVYGPTAVMEETGGQLHIVGQSNWAYVASKTAFNTPVVIHETHIVNGQSGGLVIADDDSNYRYTFRRGGAPNIGTTYDADVNGGNSFWNFNYPGVAHAENTTYSYEVAAQITNNRAEVLDFCNTSTNECNNTPTTLTQGGQPDFTSFVVAFTTYNANFGDLFADIIFVRKYSDPEPTTVVN